ncbi:hypothetical protein CMV_023294 [Castanea mollissima]|uniref:Uncharacterized protein n=1 Tax=Castanea mollissima TaxID=60419 RepID=A0A8J4VAS2_9ROSI|nr:hypothetical protein CMV_023294 [Castanea mollissima]
MQLLQVTSWPSLKASSVNQNKTLIHGGGGGEGGGGGRGGSESSFGDDLRRHLEVLIHELAGPPVPDSNLIDQVGDTPSRARRHALVRDGRRRHVFVTENLVWVLSKYDHNQYYYIGSLLESHLQNIYFLYDMAYDGGGFAISYTLAKALEKMQDRCIQWYPGLYGSDDQMQACMAELDVPLTEIF